MLSAAQRAAFEEHGLLRLPGFVECARVDALRERVLARLRELVPEPCPSGFAVTPSWTASVVNACGFESVWGKDAFALLDELLGAGAWHRPGHAGQLLVVTYPESGVEWRLPHKVWHLDYPAPGALRTVPGLQLFLCVGRVAPRAGGTLVIGGSHRLVDALRRREGPAFEGRSSVVRQHLRAEVPWLADLASLRAGEDRDARFMARPSPWQGASLQVFELAGEPGDVFVMHPWLLHAPSANCGALPRLVLTERIRALDPFGRRLPAPAPR